VLLPTRQALVGEATVLLVTKSSNASSLVGFKLG
jgi:hypothetical protein